MYRVRQGFTLVEIAIVVVVVALLCSIVVVVYGNVQQRSRDDLRLANTKQLMDALNTYFSQNGEYPNVCPGGDNSGCSTTLLAPQLVPTYIREIPTDPSGRSSMYVRGVFPNMSYGLLVSYEASQTCKTGKNYNGNFTYDAANNTWWGPVSSVPICNSPLPD